MSRHGYGIAIGLSLLAGSALADGFTGVHAPPGVERTHAQILSDALGGAFSASGLNLTNGSVTAYRNQDVGGLGSTDEVWKARKYRAKLIGNEDYGRVSDFGYVDRAHSNGRPFVSVFSTDTVDARAFLDMEHQFRWAILRSDGEVFTSLASDQHGRDQMVSYSLVNSLGESIGSVLFFEDHLLSDNKDFNDVAVMLTLTPTPQAASLGALGLMGIAVGGRRRRSVV